MALQHTIQKSVSLTGIGLHTGQTTTVTLNPAPENYGIRFVRSDIPNSPEIEADIDNVVDLARGTAIGKGEIKIHTVEHVMSAVLALSDRLVVLNQGEVIAEGLPEDVMARPEVVSAYLGDGVV